MTALDRRRCRFCARSLRRAEVICIDCADAIVIESVYDAAVVRALFGAGARMRRQHFIAVGIDPPVDPREQMERLVDRALRAVPGLGRHLYWNGERR